MNGQVVCALSNAMEPSLKGTRCGWNGAAEKPVEVFRNSLINETKLCSLAEFEAISFFFMTQADSEGLEKIDLNYTKVDFKKIDDPVAADGLFKMAVFNRL